MIIALSKLIDYVEQMKHPPSKTIGRKYWLAKAMKIHDIYFSKGEYGFSPANFNPRNLSIDDARVEGKKYSLWRPYGRLLGAQVWRMANEASIGDVIFLETDNKNIHAWGIISGPYTFRSPAKISEEYLDKNEIHSIAVKWQHVANGDGAFRSRRGDNLCFREITENIEVLPKVMKFIDSPLPTVDTKNRGQEIPNDIEYTEGNKILRNHLITERDKNVVKLAKDLARKQSEIGMIKCETCGKIPEKDYKGIDIIEAHHRKPLAEGFRRTKPEDFAMLCPCCHRAVHKLISEGVPAENCIQSVRDILG